MQVAQKVDKTEPQVLTRLRGGFPTWFANPSSLVAKRRRPIVNHDKKIVVDQALLITYRLCSADGILQMSQGLHAGFGQERDPFRLLRKEIMKIEAYCMKCKEKRAMEDAEKGLTKNGKPITKGKCPVCGSTICRIGSAK